MKTCINTSIADIRMALRNGMIAGIKAMAIARKMDHNEKHLVRILQRINKMRKELYKYENRGWDSSDRINYDGIVVLLLKK